MRTETQENWAMTISLQDLLVLGQGRDLASERGVSCTGELPAASDPDLVARAVAARAGLGSRALILGPSLPTR